MIAFHPIADVFPLMTGAEFDELVEDIDQHGLCDGILLYEDKILDGRNRYRACLKAGVEPFFIQFLGRDPVAFAISANLRRRHLDASQRAIVAGKLATLRQGSRTDLSPIGEMSQAGAAELLNVGKRSVERAQEVLDHGAPELLHAVERGEVSVSAAATVASLPHEEQRELVARGEKEILAAAKAINAKRAEQRTTKVMADIATMSAASAALPSGRKYPVIYADPPWQYQPAGCSLSAESRTPENHYPTMAIEEIAALPVGELATDPAALFMWTTCTHLQKAFRVMEAWGFEYVTNFVWRKNSIGLGFWVRHRHEHLLIGRRGDMPTPLPALRPDSVIDAPKREHSRKPDEAYQVIERMFPALPKIELFARNARDGWAAWGNQAPAAANDNRLAA
jgi:N6-adenosine-specific RNA methylase IME4/ParB-like chromosome segregation protein Spo0J